MVAFSFLGPLIGKAAAGSAAAGGAAGAAAGGKMAGLMAKLKPFLPEMLGPGGAGQSQNTPMLTGSMPAPVNQIMPMQYRQYRGNYFGGGF